MSWQKNCNKVRMIFFYLVLYWDLREYERTSHPCTLSAARSPRGEGQTTLTLHRIARSTAPQFASWSKIEIKDRGVYRFTLVSLDRTCLYSNWARLAFAYVRAECICIRTCTLRLSGLYCRSYHFTAFSILDRETRHLSKSGIK